MPDTPETHQPSKAERSTIASLGHRLIKDGRMPDPIDPKTFLNLVEMTIHSMYELEANGEFLEQRMVMTKDEIIASAKDLKRKNPSTESRKATTITIPPQLRFTDTDNTVIEEIMAVILQHGRSADQATARLGRAIQLLEWGKQAA